jgi:hypothetical protein
VGDVNVPGDIGHEVLRPMGKCSTPRQAMAQSGPLPCAASPPRGCRARSNQACVRQLTKNGAVAWTHDHGGSHAVAEDLDEAEARGLPPQRRLEERGAPPGVMALVGPALYHARRRRAMQGDRSPPALPVEVASADDFEIGPDPTAQGSES